jgi:hypothetical protein
MHKSILRIAGIAAAVALLAGCSGVKTDNCPTMAALLDASSMTIFRQGTSPDPANVLYNVRIVDVSGKCEFNKKKRSADTDLKITFRATRAPSGDAAQYTAPYFVGITEGSARILAREAYSIPFEFAPGQASITFTDEIKSAYLAAKYGSLPYDYQVLVGLQVTKEQLEYNRNNGNYDR